MGAYTFAFFIGTALHEFGHAIALVAFGVDQYKVVIHPFLGCYTSWSLNNEYIGYVDAAGPLFNMLMGVTLLVVFWQRRQTVIPSVLLMGPVALIQEGFNSLIQVALGVTGSDSLRIIAAGVPWVVLVTVDLLLFCLGVYILAIELPLYGVSSCDGLLDKIAVVVPGFVGYMAAIYIYNIIFNPMGATRGLVLMVFSGLIAVLVAFIYSLVVNRVNFLRFDVVQRDLRTLLMVWGLTMLALFLGLLFFN